MLGMQVPRLLTAHPMGPPVCRQGATHRVYKASTLLTLPKRSSFLSHEPEQQENKRPQITAGMGHA